MGYCGSFALAAPKRARALGMSPATRCVVPACWVVCPPPHCLLCLVAVQLRQSLLKDRSCRLVHLVFIKNLCIEQDVFELRGIARVKAIAFKNLPDICVFRAN